MKNVRQIIFVLFVLIINVCASAQNNHVAVEKSIDGFTLKVNGRALIINGVNWDYFPVGTNYSYSLWNQSDDFIKKALDDEMKLLRLMGVNTIRVYTGIQSKWIEYIYKNYGIYTMLNHSFGRYGLTLDGEWCPNTDYDDPRVKELLIDEVNVLAKSYKNTPGLLLFLLGNENNYGLFWEGAETEDIPEKDDQSTKRARAMYKLFNEAAISMKNINSKHPVAICNGDLQFLDIIADECTDIDILGINVYRGKSFGDLFERAKKEFEKPVLLTEFGSDALNALSNSEAQYEQAKINLSNWQEIYLNASGMGEAENSLGGFIFQFSDGWWKYGQTKNLKKHDTNASWSNGGYTFDYKEGQNNMNEEWFGICAKGLTGEDGHYPLYPRAAYYVLQQAHSFNPYENETSPRKLESHFNDIDVMDAVLKAKGDNASLEANPETNDSASIELNNLANSAVSDDCVLATTYAMPVPQLKMIEYVRAYSVLHH